MQDANRLGLLWGPWDLVAFLVVVYLPAVLVASGLAGLSRITRGRSDARLASFIFLLWPVLIFQVLPPSWLGDDRNALIFWVLLSAGGLGWHLSVRHPAWMWKEKAWMGVKVVSPITIVLLFSLVRFPFYAVDRPGQLHQTPPGRQDRPLVLLFLADGVGIADMVDEEGRWRTDLPHTKAFAEQAVWTLDAVSCGPNTRYSVPNLFRQRRFQPPINKGWDDSMLYSIVEDEHPQGLLRQAKKEGYRTLSWGPYLPLKQMSGPLLDGAYIHPFGRYFDPVKKSRYVVEWGMRLLESVAGPYRKGLLYQIPGLRWVPGRRTLQAHYGHVISSAAYAAEFMRTEARPGDLLFVHMLVPHFPYVFDLEGRMDIDHATFEGGLYQADRLFGQMIQALKDRGLYENSVIIFTSDHTNHQQAPRCVNQRLEVPWAVKLPGQDSALQIQGPVHLWELGDFFGAVFQGRLSDALEFWTKQPGAI